MKTRIFCVISLMVLLYSCTVYRPTDVLVNADQLKVYWLNPNAKHEAIFMGDDSSNISARYKTLFAGKSIPAPIHNKKPTGEIVFSKNGTVTLDCFYSMGSYAWIAYPYEHDTVFLELNASAKALLGGYKTPSPDRFAWLQGVWMADNEHKPVFEEWKIGANDYPVGVKYSIDEGDTTVNEIFSICKEHGAICYTTRVPSLHGGNSIRFEWQPSADEHILSFVNPWHGLLQDISYRLINPDSLVAAVKGKDSILETGMRRIFPRKPNL